MKRFFQFVKKETIQIVRDYRTMMIIVLMPVVLIVLFGFTISTEVNNVNIAIVSPSRQGETLRKLEHRLAANKYITISETHPASPNEADRLMKEGVIDMAIVVDKDLENSRQPKHSHAPQSANAKRIHLRARNTRPNHFNYLHSYHFYFNCSGKRIRHDGLADRIAHTAIHCDIGETHPLLDTLLHQPCHHSDIGKICFRRPNEWKHFCNLLHIYFICLAFIGVWDTDIDVCGQSNHGNTHICRSHAHSRYNAFRTFVPDRKPAKSTAMAIVHRSCPLVH